MRFREWLKQQRDRKDRIGRFARALGDRDVKRYSRRRKPDEHRKWANIVVRYGTRAHRQAFNDAWREFQKAKARLEKSTA